MSEIYSNDALKIIQDMNNMSMYQIKFNYPSPSLARSLIKTHIIQGGTISTDYLTMRFKANSVVPFNIFRDHYNKIKGKEILSINLVASMLSSLSLQLSHIILKEGKTIMGYSPENVIVINGDVFAFIGSEYLIDIDEECKDDAIISFPFVSNDFFASPELLSIKEIPSRVHYKSTYFSLGCLILFALSTSDNFNNVYNDYLKEPKSVKIYECLNELNLKNTKFYWLLSRCLVEDPVKRSIYFL